MDVLRKELNEIYTRQNLSVSDLPSTDFAQLCERVSNIVALNDGYAVITDIFSDKGFLFFGKSGTLIGFSSSQVRMMELESGDEDVIYTKLHPEDLVDKRMLELEYFKFIDALPPDEKLDFAALCSIRLSAQNGEYVWFDNVTKILKLSANGKFRLVLCTYQVSSNCHENGGITPRIVNTVTGEASELSFTSRRDKLLSKREKEVLQLIKIGKLSKEIADMLNISVHTVNRHRQNILEKLNVGNSFEAVKAATEMRLL